MGIQLTKNINNKFKTKTKLVNTNISILNLNVSGLNHPPKKHRLVEWMKKQNPYVVYNKLIVSSYL